MTHALLSTEARIEKFLREENTGVVFLGALAKLRGIGGASPATLSKMSRGASLSGDTSVQMHDLILKLEALRDAAKPLRLRFDDAREVDNWLDLHHENKLTVIVVDESQE